jgi:Ca2+-transporting ATPase
VSISRSARDINGTTAGRESGEAISILHDRVPGRVRLRAAALRQRAALGPLLQSALEARAGVQSAAVNPITGSILVLFDPGRVTTDQILIWTRRSLGDRSTGADAPSDRVPSSNGRQPLPESRETLPSPRARPARGRSRRAPQENAPRPMPSLDAVRQWAHWSAGEALLELRSSPGGLSPQTAARRRAQEGANRLPELDRRTAAQILRDQLVSVPTLMLVAATGLSLATGGLADALVIASVLALNGTIGFGTERYAEGAIRALQRLGSPRATVLRDGHTHDIAGTDVVVGDVVRLRPGDLVPADGRVIESHALSVDEAPLTGESIPVPKLREPIPSPTSLAECRNLVFMGTAVATGHGRAVVTATGARTQLGRITTLVGGEVAPRTRLQEGLDELAKHLGTSTLGVTAAIFAVGVLTGLPALGMLHTAVALAISAVPEGLPAVATTALAIGMARMLRRHVVIRKLPAVEALGGVTVLCVDKTGTLTLNRMEVAEVRVDGRFMPFRPRGEWGVGRAPTATPPPYPGMPDTLRRLLEVGALCNEADLEMGRHGLRIRGSSTEGALLLAARNAGIDTDKLRDTYSLIDIRHRETGNPVMMTLHETRSGAFRLCVKGAAGPVLDLCQDVLANGQRIRLTPALRQQIQAANEDMAARGLRVLGYAEAEPSDFGFWISEFGLGRQSQSHPAAQPPDPSAIQNPKSKIPNGLTWLGLTGMEDPLRPGVAESIARCREAGIRTVILTGDHPATASAVARALGIGRKGDSHVAEASSLIGLPPPKLRQTAARIDVYARVSPEDKLRIVRALQANGEVVAMTGDGVNDGPAMKAADVGIAMGKQGTEVAKEIADMVLLEDDFDQMALAIEQGRTIYANIRRSLRYLVATNLSEVISVAFALLTRMPVPFSALQMLWMNLISDVFPALALTLEPAPPDVMRQPPRPPDEPLIPQPEWRMMSRDAVTLAAGTMAVYRWALRRHGDPAAAQGVAFTATALAEILYALACGSPFVRSEGRRIPALNGPLLGTVGATAALQTMTIFIPALRRLLGLAPLDQRDWLTILAGAVLPVALDMRRRPALQPTAARSPGLRSAPASSTRALPSRSRV